MLPEKASEFDKIVRGFAVFCENPSILCLKYLDVVSCIINVIILTQIKLNK